MVDFWDQAHYFEEEIRQKKELSPLSRFRIRKRNPPPRTICASGVRKTSALPKDSTAKLKTWYINHQSDPYPTVIEKQQLAISTGLKIGQVKTWFANARRRSKTHPSIKQCDFGIGGDSIENNANSIEQCDFGIGGDSIENNAKGSFCEYVRFFHTMF